MILVKGFGKRIEAVLRSGYYRPGYIKSTYYFLSGL